MIEVLFYVFAALVLGGAVAVVSLRNSVHAALAMIVSFLGLAGLFFLLGAYFLAVLQILVYAGAVVVLFLFVIMLLGRQPAAEVKLRLLPWAAGVAAAAILFVGVLALLRAAGGSPQLADVSPVGSSLRPYGQLLLTRYQLPLQVSGFLLLAAMVGVIVLSKRLVGTSAGGRPRA